MIRISGGQARGRNIEAPKGLKTRPTSSMVREAVFGMLQGQTQDAQILDLFCGSGAYAFEALSRGARRAVLIDQDCKAVAAARVNAKSLGYDNRTEIYQNDYIRALQILLQNDKKFDIIFLDPPYQAGFYQTAINESERLLQPDGCIVCEHPSSMAIKETQRLQVNRQKRYGIRAITILSKRENHDRDLSGEL